MKLFIHLGLATLLSGCQLLGKPVTVTEPVTTAAVAEVAPEAAAEPAALPAQLAVNDEPTALLAWVHYRASVLGQLNEERERLGSEPLTDKVWQLKRTILQLHPDTPYLSRLRVQMQLTEQLPKLPAPLAELLSWDLVFNQKLLEAESAVSALTRLNAQQHDNIERLQKTNRELQKKIDALTQIEAQLNQPAVIPEGNNGQY